MDSKDIKHIIAKVISERRFDIGMEQEELSDYADISIATISRLEHAKANVTIETLDSIMNILGLEIDIRVKKTV